MLAPFLTVHGHVESSHPDRFADKRVNAFMWLTRGHLGFSDSADTDSRGEFVLNQLLPGKWTVSIDSKPRKKDSEWPRLASDSVEITEATNEIRVGTNAVGIVRGKLKGLTENNVDGLIVRLRRNQRNAENASQRSSATDAEGRFEFFDLTPGEYGVSLYDRTRDQDTIRGSTNITVGASSKPDDLDLNVTVIKGVKAGELAPDFELKDSDGKRVKLSDFRGKIVFLDFWATWCGPCRGEIPHLKELAKNFGSRDDFVLLSVSLDTDAAKWREFIRKEQMNWRHALDDKNWEGVASKYGVTGIPTTFLLDKDGKVLKTDLRGQSVVSEVADGLATR